MYRYRVRQIVNALKWPVTIAGAFVVFGLSSEGTFSLMTSNMRPSPANATSEVNVPAPKMLVTSPAKSNPLLIATPVSTSEPVVAKAELTPPAATVPVPVEPAAAAIPGDLTLPGRIGGSAVNLRAEPTTASSALTVLTPGLSVTLGDRQGGWVHVQSGDQVGWVYSSYIEGMGRPATPQNVTTTADLRPSVAPGKILRAGIGTAVRDQPELGARRLYTLDPGERVRVAESNGKWVRIVTATGESGWVQLR